MGTGGTTVFGIAAASCFAFMIAAAVSYIRVANKLIGYLRTELPEVWESWIAEPWRRPGSSNIGEAICIRQLVLGIERLPSEDAQCRKLLRAARWRIMACAIFLAAGVIAVGWAFRGT